MEKIEVDCLIVGGGVSGLALARQLIKSNKNTILIERNETFGSEVSGRNSEVIHAGIYYKKDSLKSKLCVEGKSLLYDYLEKHHIEYKKCGKFIVSTNKDEDDKLLEIKKNAQQCGVFDLSHDKTELKKYGFIFSSEALYSPSSGIFDSHSFFLSLRDDFERMGGITLLNNECVATEKSKLGFELQVIDRNTGEKFIVITKLLVNCAGLGAVALANSIYDEEKFKNKFVKGEYYHYAGPEKLNHLIYPVPNELSLGLHATIDLGMGIKFGPSAFKVKEIGYANEKNEKYNFVNAIKAYWPSINKSQLTFSYAGVRPLLEGHDDFFLDIGNSDDNIFVNVLGYASPGLTSSLALAKHIAAKLQMLEQ